MCVCFALHEKRCSRSGAGCMRYGDMMLSRRGNVRFSVTLVPAMGKRTREKVLTGGRLKALLFRAGEDGVEGWK